MHCQTISLAHYFTRKAFLLQLIRSKLCEVNDGRVRPYYLTFVCQMASFIWENKSFYFCISTVITERLSITEKESEMKLGTKWPFDLTNILWTCGLIIGCSWVLGDSFLFFFFLFFFLNISVLKVLTWDLNFMYTLTCLKNQALITVRSLSKLKIKTMEGISTTLEVAVNCRCLKEA